MTFEEWWREYWGDSWKDGAPVSDWSAGQVEQSRIACKEAWDCQQKIIDGFKQANNDLAKAAIRPDGYVLVPVEPTEAMIDAWWDTHIDGETLDEAKAYKAMVQAAQEEE
jgi:hypothetical protein